MSAAVLSVYPIRKPGRALHVGFDGGELDEAVSPRDPAGGDAPASSPSPRSWWRLPSEPVTPASPPKLVCPMRASVRVAPVVLRAASTSSGKRGGEGARVDDDTVLAVADDPTYRFDAQPVEAAHRAEAPPARPALVDVERARSDVGRELDVGIVLVRVALAQAQHRGAGGRDLRSRWTRVSGASSAPEFPRSARSGLAKIVAETVTPTAARHVTSSVCAPAGDEAKLQAKVAVSPKKAGGKDRKVLHHTFTPIKIEVRTSGGFWWRQGARAMRRPPPVLEPRVA